MRGIDARVVYLPRTRQKPNRGVEIDRRTEKSPGPTRPPDPEKHRSGLG
jgi:hypothetical protein